MGQFHGVAHAQDDLPFQEEIFSYKVLIFFRGGIFAGGVFHFSPFMVILIAWGWTPLVWLLWLLNWIALAQEAKRGWQPAAMLPKGTGKGFPLLVY